MRNFRAIRWIVVAAVLTALLASAVSFRADAQSELMRGDRMPYDAFDRLPKTDLEISGSTIHVGFAPGEMALPREKVLDWVRMSAKAVVDLLRPLSGHLAAAVAGAGRRRPRFAAAPPGAIAAPPFAFRSAATPPRMFCGATG